MGDNIDWKTKRKRAELRSPSAGAKGKKEKDKSSPEKETNRESPTNRGGGTRKKPKKPPVQGRIKRGTAAQKKAYGTEKIINVNKKVENNDYFHKHDRRSHGPTST